MQENNNQNCGCSNGECSPASKENNQVQKNQTEKNILPKVTRKDFLKFLGISPLVSFSAFSQITKEKGERYDAIPVDKKLSSEWIKSLYQRGKPHTYKEKKDLPYIGMPVGGFCTGTLYLGGDGKLWNWDIFNTNYGTRSHRGVVATAGGQNYRDPFIPTKNPLESFANEFYLTTKKNGKKTTQTLDYKGFKNIRYTAEYPVSKIEYKSKQAKVTLHGYSPFIPLDFKHSSYPATILEYEVENISNQKMDFALGGILENLVCRYENKNILRNKNLFKKNVRINGKNYKGIHYELGFSEEADQNLINKVKNLNGYGSLSLAIISAEEKNINKEIHTYTHFENLEKRQVKKSFKNKCLSDEAIGNVEQEFSLAPKQKKKITFVLSWHFKNNNSFYDGNRAKNYYAIRFTNAEKTIQEVSKKYSFLKEKTFQWKKLFYQKSNLPYWLLQRSIVTICCLATRTSHFLNDNGEGYFWAWEGIDCCPGTCNHVWQYQQTMARLFPELEKNIRIKSTFPGIKSDGVFTYRVDIKENRDQKVTGKGLAVDGQLGEILRIYRDTLLSSSNKYLKEHWDKIKKGMNRIIKKFDKNRDGVLTGNQFNTLDAGWGGEIAWITSIYLAALKACFFMSETIGDEDFRKKVSCILKKGEKNIDRLFFNDEFFIQKKSRQNDLGHSVGCHIDQVFGQSWAFQLGLGRLFDQGKIRKALNSLWKYNFAVDMGDFREEFKLKGIEVGGNENDVPSAGRTYAMKDDKALIMTSFPYGGRGRAFWANGYYQEAMTGFEYQVASHMIWEGTNELIEKGLAITKAIDDRYFGSPHKRNPYNEIECGDHYARAMSSYGVYTAACGFDYNGPEKRITFEPRMNFNNFKSSFTTESAWGLFSQRVSKKKGSYSLEIFNDSLSLKKITLAANSKVSSVDVKLSGKKVFASLVQQENKITDKSIFSVVFSKEVNIKEKQVLKIEVA